MVAGGAMPILILSVCSVLFFIGMVVFIVLFLVLKKNTSAQNVEEEIIDLVEEGSKQGVLENSEAEMIHNIFEFGDKMTKDIMTPRSNIAAIDAESTLAEAREMMLKLPYSRYPVFINDLDHIIGVIHLKDIVRYTQTDHDDEEIIKNNKSLMRKAVFIPETKDVDDLFKRMQAERIQMAIVLDEYGQTSGLIAMEDILEEIVGNILDEYDINNEMIRKIAGDSYEADGLVQLEDIDKVLQTELVNEEYDTLSGFITDHLKHIPTDADAGFTFSASGYDFTVESVEKHVIKKALIKKTAEAEKDKEFLNDSAKNDNI